MPKNSRVPTYRRHKPTGQAVVTLDGKDHYLGKWNTTASKAEYSRLIGEWLAADRHVPASGHTDLTVAEMAARYWQFAQGYYVKNGCPTGWQCHIRLMLRLLRQHYGYTLATDFGPLSLKALRQRLIRAGHSRKYINKLVAIVPRAFKWAVAEELLPIRVYEALRTVEGLRKGRTEAHETEPVTPVADTTVNATLPCLPLVVADMVQFQRLTGCRPAEVCLIRPCDVETSEAVWSYRPESHKTEHHGRERVIFIGPKAQDVLRPYLLREKAVYCFVPAESERKRNAQKRENRQSPMTPSQARRQLKRHPRRAPGDRYSTDSYRRAIERACETAFGMPNELRRISGKLPADERRRLQEQAAAWRSARRWHPNQLRHSAATEIRRKFGLEAAQVALGHSQANVTQLYAERDMNLAAEVMRKIG